MKESILFTFATPSVVHCVSTFDARPLHSGLNHWLGKLGAPVEIVFAPGCQPTTTLLAAEVSSVTPSLTMVTLRIEDLANEQDEAASEDSEVLTTAIAALADAVRASARRTGRPHAVAVCPASPTWSTGRRAVAAAAAEAELTQRLAGVAGIQVLSSAQAAGGASREVWFHPLGWEMGRVPYRPASYFALARALARLIHQSSYPPYKALVLDCDDTLWRGVCAEDGPGGVRFDERHRQLQQFARQAMTAGVLVCLCSKNTLEDVRAVFAHHPQLALGWDDFAAVRINWLPKSTNLDSLAEELGLGLDAFVFIDDNAVECAEVRSQHPEVVAIHLPAQGDIQPLLDQVWAFDRQTGTLESARRTVFHHEARQREAARQAAATLDDFVAGLDLRVAIDAPEPSMWPRLAEILLRTNQFNLGQSRDDEQGLRARAETAFHHVRAVRVADRFGDYGLVGVLAWRHDGATVMLDTFALSCRALGRGVEHRMLAHAGHWALSRGCDSIVMPFRAGPRSDPGRVFLAEVAGHHVSDVAEAETVEFSASLAAAARMTTARAASPPDARRAAPVSAGQSHVRARGLEEIASQPEAGNVFHELVGVRRPRPQTGQHFIAPRTDAERRVAAVWCAVLNLDTVGVDDPFVDLGGRSLDLVEVYCGLSAADRSRIAFTDLFRFTTVTRLAGRLDECHEGIAKGNPFQVRAGQRRQALSRQSRKVSIR